MRENYILMIEKCPFCYTNNFISPSWYWFKCHECKEIIDMK